MHKTNIICYSFAEREGTRRYFSNSPYDQPVKV